MIRIVIAVTLVLAAAHLDAADEKRPWLGMSVRADGDAERGRFLHVERTVAGGPSDRAGIRPGDIIRKINGTSLQHMDDLEFLLFIGERKPNERVRFDVIRNGVSRVITVRLGVMPPSAYEGWQRALQNARRLRLRAQQRAH